MARVIAHNIRRRARAGGFSLLELLLAVAILASLAALAGAAFSQSRFWSEVDASSERALRLERVLATMRQQWGDRRTGLELESLGGAVSTAPKSVRFVTNAPILFPDWPLVIATWAIEEDPDHFAPGGAPTHRLVYAETRVTGPEGAPNEDAQDRLGRPFTESIVLLDALTELRWERFGRAPDADVNAADEDDRKQRWRPYAGEFEGDVPAVRLVGVHEGDRFGCVLVVQPLR